MTPRLKSHWIVYEYLGEKPGWAGCDPMFTREDARLVFQEAREGDNPAFVIFNEFDDTNGVYVFGENQTEEFQSWLDEWNDDHSDDPDPEWEAHIRAVNYQTGRAA